MLIKLFNKVLLDLWNLNLQIWFTDIGQDVKTDNMLQTPLSLHFQLKGNDSDVIFNDLAQYKAEVPAYIVGGVLTTVFCSSVVSNHYSLVNGAEECCPVNGVIITQVAVVSNVDVARADFLQRLEL